MRLATYIKSCRVSLSYPCIMTHMTGPHTDHNMSHSSRIGPSHYLLNHVTAHQSITQHDSDLHMNSPTSLFISHDVAYCLYCFYYL